MAVFKKRIMFEGLKKAVQKLRAYPPGERFIRQYQKRQARRSHLFYKILFVSSGLLIMLLGFFLLVFPGPGILTILVGLALMAQESFYMARLLDWLEIRLRRWMDWSKAKWQKSSRLFKIMLILLVLIICMVVVYGAYLLIF